MKKNRFLAITLTLVMCLGMVSPAYAIDYNAEDGTVHVDGSESWQDDHEEWNESNKYNHAEHDDYEVNISGETDQKVVEVTEDASDDIQVNISDVTADVEEGPAADIQGGSVNIEDSNLSTEDENSAAVVIGGNADVTVSGGTTTVTGSGTGVEMSSDSSLTVESGGNLQVNGSETSITNSDRPGTHIIGGGNTGIDMSGSSSLTVENGGSLEANGSSVTVDTDDKKNTITVGGENTGIEMKDESSVSVEYGGKLEANGSDVYVDAFAQKAKDDSTVKVDGGNTGIKMESPDTSLTVNGIADISGGKVSEGLTNWAEVKTDSDGNQALNADSAQVTVGPHGKLSVADSKAAETVSGKAFGRVEEDGVTITPNWTPSGFDNKTPSKSFNLGTLTKKVGETGFALTRPINAFTHKYYMGMYYPHTSGQFIPESYAGINATLGTGGVITIDPYSVGSHPDSDGYSAPGLQTNLRAAMPGETTVELEYCVNYNLNGGYDYCTGCGALIPFTDNSWHKYRDTFTVVVNADYELSYSLNGGKLEEDEPIPSSTKTVASTLGSFDVTGQQPTREGFTFQGWGLKDENGDWIRDKDGSIVTFQGGDSVTLQWKEGLGGTGNPVKGTLCAVWDEVAPEPEEPDTKPDTKPEEPKPEEPKPEEPKPEEPKPEEPKPEEPKPENPDPDDPDPDDPDPDDPDPDDPNTPSTPDTPVTPNTPNTDVPQTVAPVISVPNEAVPLAENPVTDVPDGAVPLAEETPIEEVADPDVPLSPAPEIEEIKDPGVPLADAPQTGDNSGVWTILALISGMGLAWLALLDKKRKGMSK